MQLALADSGIDYPTHHFQLRSLERRSNPAKVTVNRTEAGNIVRQTDVCKWLNLPIRHVSYAMQPECRITLT
jgi:hypothetical protein